MNSVTQTVAEIKTPASDVAAFREWMVGFNLCADGGFEIDCANEQQRRGYRAAAKAEAQFAAAATPQYSTDGYRDEPGFGIVTVINGEYVYG